MGYMDTLRAVTADNPPPVGSYGGSQNATTQGYGLTPVTSVTAPTVQTFPVTQDVLDMYRNVQRRISRQANDDHYTSDGDLYHE